MPSTCLQTMQIAPISRGGWSVHSTSHWWMIWTVLGRRVIHASFLVNATLRFKAPPNLALTLKVLSLSCPSLSSFACLRKWTDAGFSTLCLVLSTIFHSFKSTTVSTCRWFCVTHIRGDTSTLTHHDQKGEYWTPTSYYFGYLVSKGRSIVRNTTILLST